MSWRPGTASVVAMLLVVAAAGLGVRVHSAWRHLDDPVEIATIEASADALQVDDDIQMAKPPAAALAAIVERPLFSPTRRPPQPPPVQVAAPAPAPTPAPPTPIGFSLVGVALSDGKRVALVRRQEDGRVLSVPEGTEVLGWTVQRIESDSASFRRGASEEILVLQFARGQAEPPGADAGVAQSVPKVLSTPPPDLGIPSPDLSGSSGTTPPP